LYRLEKVQECDGEFGRLSAFRQLGDYVLLSIDVFFAKADMALGLGNQF
jgi:hypothetical protein